MIFTLLPCSGITPKKREWISFKIRLSWVSGKSQGTHLKRIITNTNIQTQTQTCLISEKKNQNSRKERNKMPETENRPRGEVRSQREERQCLHTNKNNKLLVAECIDNDIIDMTSSLIEIALRIRVQHFILTGQGRWRERRRRRRRRKSGTCQNTQIYYQLSVSGSESARVCALALSNFVCMCVWLQLRSHMRRVFGFGSTPCFCTFAGCCCNFGHWLSLSLLLVLLLLFHFHSRRRMYDNKWSTWGPSRRSGERMKWKRKRERERERERENWGAAWYCAFKRTCEQERTTTPMR